MGPTTGGGVRGEVPDKDRVFPRCQLRLKGPIMRFKRCKPAALLTICITVAAALSLAGCGSDDDDTTMQPPVVQEDTSSKKNGNARMTSKPDESSEETGTVPVPLTDAIPSHCVKAGILPWPIGNPPRAIRVT